MVREGRRIEDWWVKCYKEDAIQIKFSLLSAFRVVTPNKSYSGIYIGS